MLNARIVEEIMLDAIEVGFQAIDVMVEAVDGC